MSAGKASRAQAKVGRWAARTVHAAIEGFAFLWTVPGHSNHIQTLQTIIYAENVSREFHQRNPKKIVLKLCSSAHDFAGFRLFLAANSVALCYYLGPKRSTAVAFNSALICACGKFAHVLFTSASEQGGDEELGSIWDYDPPGELASSGAWVVLRGLATTLNSANELFPELKTLQPLPVHEMALRLCFVFDHYDKNPVCEQISGKESPDAATLEHLGEMLWFADQAYEGESERTLHGRLMKRGFGLAHVKLASTWAEHCPAYYVALNLQAKELLIAVRGTAQVEDVITDLTALPQELGDTGHLVHSGILASAEWLSERLSCIAQGLHEAGYKIITVGHSLGAGAAAILAMILRSRGVERLQCYAFACPPCVHSALAAECKDYVHSVALRDDVVARFSPQALAGLHEELRAFDLESAKQAQGLTTGLQTMLHVYNAVEALQNAKFPGFSHDVDEKGRTAAQKAKEGEKKREELEESEDQLQNYKPQIPGTVLYLHRTEDEGIGRAVVDGSFEGLQRICLSAGMITDHLANSYYDALGQPNLTHKTFIEEGKMTPPPEDEPSKDDISKYDSSKNNVRKEDTGKDDRRKGDVSKDDVNNEHKTQGGQRPE